MSNMTKHTEVTVDVREEEDVYSSTFTSVEEATRYAFARADEAKEVEIWETTSGKREPLSGETFKEWERVVDRIESGETGESI